MKIDRLIGILSILLQQDKVTAPYLAEKFEVSRRTINRDVEDLCKAGIPLLTMQGQNGGISIMEGYRMDKTLLTSSDMQAILAGLRSLDSVTKSNRYQQLMDKLAVGNTSILSSNNHIMIDLSSWYKSSISPKIELIQNALENNHLIRFKYYSPSGESERHIEPYYIVFQWSNWYVWGYCRERKDYRMFKLKRMMNLVDTMEIFKPRKVPEFEIKPEVMYPIKHQVLVRIKEDMKWRLIEEFGRDSFEAEEKGSLLFRSGFSDKDNLFGWLLSFGEDAELLEPENLRTEFSNLIQNISGKYTLSGSKTGCPPDGASNGQC